MELLILLLLAAQETPQPPFEATVVKKWARIRSEPKPLAKTLIVLNEKQTVTVLELADQWTRVKASSGEEGWTRTDSVIETKAYVLREQATGTGSAAAVGVQMAGKGFDKKTEQEYKSKEGLDQAYVALDRLEGKLPDFRSDPKELDQRLSAFREEGKLGEHKP